MQVTPLVLIQVLSKRTRVGRLKYGSDPQDEGHLACLLLLYMYILKPGTTTLFKTFAIL